MSSFGRCSPTMRTLASSFTVWTWKVVGCCCPLLLAASSFPVCCNYDCRLVLCLIDLMLVTKVVVVPAVVVVAIVPAICCIVIVVILLLDLVDWRPAVSSKMPWLHVQHTFAFAVVLSSLVVLSFSCFSYLSVAFSVAFSCILPFAFHMSFTLAFVSFSFSFVALPFEFSLVFSSVAFPCHSYFHWLWAI